VNSDPSGDKAFSNNLKRVHWLQNFKPSGIEKYDGSTNPAKWLEVFQLTIEAAGGDKYCNTPYYSYPNLSLTTANMA
jgi:hypothetical protein